MPVYFWKQRLIFDQVKTHSQERKGMLRDSALGWCIIHSFYHFFATTLFMKARWRKKKKKKGRKYRWEKNPRNVSITACEFSFTQLQSSGKKRGPVSLLLPTRHVDFNSRLSNMSPAPQVATCNTMPGVCKRKVISSKYNDSMALFSLHDHRLSLTFLSSAREPGAFHY